MSDGEPKAVEFKGGRLTFYGGINPFAKEEALARSIPRAYSDEEVEFCKFVLDKGEHQPDGSIIYWTLPNISVHVPPVIVARYRKIVGIDK